jgi:lipoate-protein ligase B
VTISLLKIRTPMGYQAALELQHAHGVELERSTEKIAKLILLQHTPVFTLGRKTEAQHLLCSEHDLAVRTGAEVIHVDRGGSITYHGPGQITAYLLLNLSVWNIGIHEHLDKLESAAMNALARFGITGHREPGMTGVWVGPSGSPLPREGEGLGVRGPASEKICAIGVSARRWVTYHGLSLNVDLNLQPFYEVVPCGLTKPVTSIAKLLGRPVRISEVEPALSAAFGEVYGAKVEVGMV